MHYDILELYSYSYIQTVCFLWIARNIFVENRDICTQNWCFPFFRILVLNLLPAQNYLVNGGFLWKQGECKWDHEEVWQVGQEQYNLDGLRNEAGLKEEARGKYHEKSYPFCPNRPGFSATATAVAVARPTWVILNNYLVIILDVLKRKKFKLLPFSRNW